MEFCCGSWLEGGKPMGNLLESLRDFLKREKVVIIHLRNVTSPLPKFTETFLDDGYGDIFEIIRTVTEHKYSGTIILDHSPEFNSVKGAETAFALGYIKASIRAAQALQEARPTDLTAILDEKTPKKSTTKKPTSQQQDSTPKKAQK
jgi:mannonate dehydratase